MNYHALHPDHPGTAGGLQSLSSLPGHADASGVAIQVSRDIVLAFIQVDLDEDLVARFQADLLRKIQESAPRGAIIDLSALDTIDSREFAALRQVLDAASIMGAETVLAGLRPGVVSALIEAGVAVEGLRAAVNLDAAFALFDPQPVASVTAESDHEAAEQGTDVTDGNDPVRECEP